MEQITIGSDPEFGISDFGGIPKSGVGLIKGTKKRPLSIGEGCFRQEDNVGAELTFPPTRSVDEFLYYIQYGRKKIDEILAEHELQTVAISSMRYAPEELRSKKAMTFGCEPSFDAYTEQVSYRPEPEDVGNLRSFGFHFHLGWKGNKHHHTIEDLVKLCDVYMGLPSILLDDDTERRQLYGNPGDFRFTSYGFEYRTLGGALLRSPEIIAFLYQQLLNVVEDYKHKVSAAKINLCSEEIQLAIKNSDVGLTKELLQEFNININIQNCEYA
jgi:hypothetical protein